MARHAWSNPPGAALELQLLGLVELERRRERHSACDPGPCGEREIYMNDRARSVVSRTLSPPRFFRVV